MRTAVGFLGIVTHPNDINSNLGAELYKVSSMFLEPLAHYRVLAAN